MKPETLDTRATANGEFVAPDAGELSELLVGYEVVDLIACGGMGAVYRARQVALDREVALKILPRELGEEPEFRRSFQTEARAMARLNHPNLIGVHDSGSVDGMPFIVMEYVPGKSLHHSAYDKKIEPAEAARLVRAILAGLAEAHEQGIIHRDIKPANILLNQKAEPKLGDFGLATPAGDDAPGLLMGTPGYTAPEVIRDPRSADQRSDIFAVGVILYELLTGEMPNEQSPPPSVACDCPPIFDSVCQRATHPNPAFRYRDCAAMVAALEPAVEPAGKGAARRKAPVKFAGRPQAAAPSAARPATPAARLSEAQAATKMEAKLKRGLVIKLVIIAVLLVAICFVAARVFDPKRRTPDPHTPANLIAIAGDGKVTLDWEDNRQSGFARFIVRRSTTMGGPYTDVPGATPTASTYTDTALINGSTYYYVVAAKNRLDQVSANSNEVSATLENPTLPEPEPPTPPEPDETPLESLARLKSALAAGEREPMPIGTTRRGESDFFLVTRPMGWHRAAHFAEQHGGHLAVPSINQDLTWFSEQIEKSGCGSAWIGAGRCGSLKWAMIDGTAWTLQTKPVGAGDFAALDDLGLVRGTKPDTKYPFIIQWHRDSSNPGTLEAMLRRVRESIDQPEPCYPPGTESFTDGHYLIVVREAEWIEAAQIAESSGGRLAALPEAAEGSFVREMVNKTLPPGAAAWIGLRYRDGKPAWITGETGKFWDWVPGPPDGDETAESVFRLVTGENGGWDAADPTDVDAASSFVIEWSPDQIEDRDRPPPAPVAGDWEKLRRQLAEAVGAEQDAHTKAIQKNGEALDRDLRDWFGRDADNAEKWRFRPGIIRALETIHKVTGRIDEALVTKFEKDVAARRARGLPPELGPDVNDHLDKQRNLDADLETLLEKWRRGYLERMNKFLKTAQDNRNLGEAGAIQAEIDACDTGGKAFAEHFETVP